MNGVINQLRVLPWAGSAVLIIFAGLANGGAETTERALLLAAALSVTLALASLTTPRESLAAALARNAVPGFAALGFLVWSGLCAWPGTTALAFPAHPLASSFGWTQTASSISPSDTLLSLLISFGPIAAFGLGAIAGAAERTRSWSARGLILAALCLGAVALNIFVTEDRRLDAGLSSPNAAAALFGACALFAFAMTMRAGRRARYTARALPPILSSLQGLVSAPMSAAATLTCLICALLTGSRAGVAATVLGFAVLVVLILIAPRGPFSPDWRKTGLLALPAAVIALVLLATGPLAAALDLGDRQVLAEAHWSAFLDRPWLGHGLGTYDQVNLMLMTPENHRPLEYAGAAHNLYVQALEEVGLIGGLLVGIAVAVPIWAAGVNLAGGGPGREWSAAALGISTLFLSHSALDYTLHVPAIAALFAFMLGLLCQPRSAG